MGWFGRNKAQKQLEETVQQQRRQYEIRKTQLFEQCRIYAEELVDDNGRAGSIGALASNLITGEPHPRDLLDSISEKDRESARNIADRALADPEMREFAGDTIFWLAEALFSQGFDTKTNIQSSESVEKAKELLQLARDRGGDKALYFSLLSQVQMSAGEFKKAHTSAIRGEKELPPLSISEDASTRILRSELLRLTANAAVALGNFEEAKFAYMAAKDFNPKIQGVDEALRALRGR